MKWLRLSIVILIVVIMLVFGVRILDSGFAAAPASNASPLEIAGPGKANSFFQGSDPTISLNGNDGANPSKPLAPQTGLTCGGVFTATADAFVRQSMPAANYGYGSLLVGQGNQGENQMRMLLTFDPTGSVPDGATIQKAEIELYLDQDPAPPTYTLQVFSQDDDWGEYAVTWTNQPTPTIGFGAVSYGITHTMPLSSVVRLDVTTWAMMWANGVISHNGLTVSPGRTQATMLSFYGREANLGLYAPRLKIYCVPKKTIIPLDSNPGDLRQVAGLNRLMLTSAITPALRLDRGSVRFAEVQIPIPSTVSKNGVERARWFTRVYSDVLRISDPEKELQLVRRSPDDRHIFFRQLHLGIPVYPAELAVHLKESQVTGVSGGTVPDITVDSTPRLSVEQAETIALKLAGAGAKLNGDTQLAYLNLGLIGAPDYETYLAWRVNLSNGTAAFIDANNGRLVYEQGDTTEGWDLDLNTGNHTGPSETCCYFHWPPWSSTWWGDETGTISSADTEGDEAWWSAAYAWGFWWYNYGNFHSYDNDGAEYEMYIHVGWWPNIAHWVPDCDYFEFTDGAARAKDIVGHEFAHAVMDGDAMPQFEYSWWSGALEESFADIFGMFAENKFDWFIGEDDPYLAAWQRRDMASPDRPTMADTACDGTDKGCIHSNNGVHNKAAYHLTEGGQFNGYDMQSGIGRDKAKMLFYFMLYRLGTNADFMQAREQAIGEAKDLASSHSYNFNTHDVCIIMRAYASVGLGNGDWNCDGVEDSLGPDSDYDHIRDAIDNCITTANPGQADFDNDDIGDACDPDSDGDAFVDIGFPNACAGGNVTDCNDNCQFTWQADQADWNGNAIGDACDDFDGDGINDNTDNCVEFWNKDQKVSDNDSMGDACDADDDNDGVLDFPDNCPVTYNPTQDDHDVFVSGNWAGDGIGDACDLCPNIFNTDNSDPDGDGMANPCDPDNDDDGVLDDGDLDWVEGNHPCKEGNIQNCDDNCPLKKNPDQFDYNGNGIGFACEPGDIPNLGDHDSHQYTWRTDEAIVIPLPGGKGVHPDWGHDYLEKGYRESVSVETSTDVFAQIVNSSGAVEAKSTRHGLSLRNQVLSFKPAPYAVDYGVSKFFGGAVPAQPSDEIDASSIRYYLQLIPLASTPLNEPLTVTLQISGGVPPNIVYLPLIRK